MELGNISLRDLSIFINGKAISDMNKSSFLPKEELERVILHEAIHYFQLATTLDGYRWFRSSLHWTDALREDLRISKGVIEIPFVISLPEEFSNSLNKYLMCRAEEELFLSGQYKIYTDVFRKRTEDFPKPTLNLGNKHFMEFSLRHLYEGFARINQLIWENRKQGSIEKFYENRIEILGEEWPFLLCQVFGCNIPTILALIDFALMGNPYGWDVIDYKKIDPSWRFVQAFQFAIDNKLSFDADADLLDYEAIIAQGLKWKSIENDLLETINEATTIEPSMSYDWSYGNLKDDKRFDELKNVSKISEVRLRHFLDSFKARSNRNRTDIIKFIMPGMYFDELLNRFTPPVIISNDPKSYIHLIKKGDMLQGMDDYYRFKITCSIELMTGFSITCPFLSTSELPGTCENDRSCKGIFPRQDCKVPNCLFEELFSHTFHRSIADIRIFERK